MLCSLVVDLKISEIVDAGQYVVSAVLPESIFRRPRLERGLQDPFGDRGGGGAALARVGQHHGDRHRGLDAGAKATNQAVVFAAFWAMSAVETSSAVPVLPAT